MRILHISDGWERTNGVATVARLIAGEQAKAGASVEFRRWATVRELKAADEVWIHCAWKPCLWWASLWARKSMRMPHGSYDPVRLGYHGWKKRIVGPFERFFLRRAAKVLGTCAAEADWVKAYEPQVKAVEVLDLKRYFGLGEARSEGGDDARRVGYGRELHVMYLGRRHPLKGIECLERAVKVSGRPLSLRLVSDHRGEELERDWEWCDVLCLPTLSENFGLVVAEALTRGKRVIVTDGAPAWEGSDYGGRLLYVKGYRVGDDETRVRLLVQALSAFA